MKFEWNRQSILLIAIAVAAVAALVWVAWPGAKAPPATQVLNDLMKAEIAVKEAAIAGLDKEVLALTAQAAASEKRYQQSMAKVAELHRIKDNVREPVTNKELRDRFTAAGFPMLPGR
jgi:hypothetical protein